MVMEMSAAKRGVASVLGLGLLLSGFALFQAPAAAGAPAHAERARSDLGSAVMPFWQQSRLPPGCTFSADPQKPYLSGGRIYSKVSFKVGGCKGMTFNRVFAIAEATTPDAALPWYRLDAPGVVPDDAFLSASMPCKRGNWATTISLSFSNKYYYAFAQSGGILSVTKC